MNFINRRRWRVVRNYCIGWTLAFAFLSIVRGVGTMELGELKFDFVSSLLISLTIGPIIGFISGYSQVLMEERIYQRISIQRFLVIRLLYSILIVFALILIAYAVYQFYFGADISLIAFAFDSGSFAIYFYVLFVDIFLDVLRQVNLMLGEGNLGKILRGKFYTPTEEERIFMFLDLQSSTNLAERLGHIQYSSLIQDCFNDLGVVVENEAEIYQYVGDEAVLTWKLNDGLRSQNCLKSFFNFKKQLISRSDYYQNKYGCKPFFKAGLHAGIVTVTEVGKYKKEIAFHGDPINTAARIQDQCNRFNEELLMSEDLMNQIETDNYTFKAIGGIPLRGKEGEVSIYAVSQAL